jgi:hypothetical protein
MNRMPVFALCLQAALAAAPVLAQTPPTGGESAAPAAPRSTAAAEGAAKPAARPSGRGAPGGTATGAAAPRGGNARAMDRLELDTTQITGNRELPKVMVVVPWKKSDIGDLVGKPVNSLVDEALEPVDREVFRREVDYYGALAPDRPTAGRSETGVTAPAGAPRAEK